MSAREMRWGVCSVIGIVLLSGCATRHVYVPAAPGSGEAVDLQARPPQEDAIALALAFDPPVTVDQAPLNLDREPREPAAFVGYDEPVTTFSDLRVDDRLTSDHHGRYERRAISERIGVSTR